MGGKIFFNTAQWIWHTGESGEDEYSEFADSFVWNGGLATVNISARGDYTLFINGKYVSSNQYADFEYYKVYDEVDITDYLTEGVNTIAVIGWYFGESGMRWYTPQPGIIYEIKNNDNVICASTEATPCRKSRAYFSGRKKRITLQLGFTFLYDARKEDNWIIGGGTDFDKCRVMLNLRFITCGLLITVRRNAAVGSHTDLLFFFIIPSQPHTRSSRDNGNCRISNHLPHI